MQLRRGLRHFAVEGSQEVLQFVELALGLELVVFFRRLVPSQLLVCFSQLRPQILYHVVLADYLSFHGMTARYLLFRELQSTFIQFLLVDRPFMGYLCLALRRSFHQTSQLLLYRGDLLLQLMFSESGLF